MVRPSNKGTMKDCADSVFVTKRLLSLCVPVFPGDPLLCLEATNRHVTHFPPENRVLRLKMPP